MPSLIKKKHHQKKRGGSKSTSRPNSKSGSKSGSKTGKTTWSAGTWIGLLVFVSVWMFIFGILVGRGTVSTNFEFTESQKELYTIAEEAAEMDKKQNPPNDHLKDEMTTDPFVGLKESHSKKMTATIRPTKKNQPEKIAPKPQPVTKKVEKNNTKKAPSKQRSTTLLGKPKPGIKPKPGAKPKPPKSSKKPEKAVAQQRRILQAASMQSLDDAKRMVERLRKKGLNAYVASAVVSGKGERHRVRIGPYKNEKDAQIALLRLKQAGIQGILLKAR